MPLPTRLASVLAARNRQAADARQFETLLDWTKYFLADHATRPWNPLHRWLAAELDRITIERGSKVNVLGPRGSAKSTIMSLAYVLRQACTADDPYIWILSDTKGQAQQHLANVRYELENNELLHRFYSTTAIGRKGLWTNEAVNLANGVRIEAYGAGQRIRGRRRGSHRPTLIVGDDLQNDSHVASATLREKTRQWWWGTVAKAGRPHTNIVNAGTALHRDAITMELANKPGWRSCTFKAIVQWPKRMDLWNAWEQLYTQPEDPQAEEVAAHFYNIFRDEMHEGAKVLWPEEESLLRLMKMRAEEGHTQFEREKQSSPIDPDRCEWPEEYFKDIWYTELPPIVLTAIALDPSKGRLDRVGDWSSYAIVRLSRDGVCYVDAEMARENTPSLVRRGLRLCQQYRPDAFGVEVNAWQELLASEFNRQFVETGMPQFAPSTIENTVNKEVRIRRLGALLSQRRLRFAAHSWAARELVDQMRDFPIGAYDDGPDSLEMAIRLVENLLGGRSVRQTRMTLQS